MIEKTLKETFGLSSFRSKQEEIIRRTLERRSTVVVMPTGQGKSLCFQLPALHQDGVTVVISPLISLMKDQVDGMRKLGIPATFVNSSISRTESQNRLAGILTGKYKLVYVAPERMYDRAFIKELAGGTVSLLAVDEAHCISEWGHDFRPAYLRIHELREQLGSPTTIALTATATPRVREDIVKNLKLDKDKDQLATYVTGFRRKNLSLHVAHANRAGKLAQTLEWLRRMRGSAIVYTATRAKAEEAAEFIGYHGFKSAPYHAGLDPADRKKVQNDFMAGKLDVIVATNAFGMGIDKPDIRLVVHHEYPETLEAYYQEIGRAGRDGDPSSCVLFYSPGDRILREFFIEGENPPISLIRRLYGMMQERAAMADADTDEGGMDGSGAVTMTYAKMKEALHTDANEMAIGTSLKILEQNGLIRRLPEKANPAYVRFLKDAAAMRDIVGNRAKKQLELIRILDEEFGIQRDAGVSFGQDDIVRKYGWDKAAFTRAMKALEKNYCLAYDPPARGRGILVKDPHAPFSIDEGQLEAKKQAAFAKLERMEHYIFTSACRHANILDYFEDNERIETCGQCDNCGKRTRLAEAEEIRYEKSPGSSGGYLPDVSFFD